MADEKQDTTDEKPKRARRPSGGARRRSATKGEPAAKKAATTKKKGGRARAKSKKRRVYEIAKEIGISNKELIEEIKTLTPDVRVSTAMTSLTEEEVAEVKSALGIEQESAPIDEAKADEAAPAKKPRSRARSKKRGDAEPEDAKGPEDNEEKASRPQSARGGEEAEQSVEPATKSEPQQGETQKAPISEVARAFLANFGARDAPKKEEPAEPVEVRIPSSPREGSPQSMLRQGRTWLDELFSLMQLTIEVSSSYDKASKTLHFNLGGEGARALLGPSGTSARALEGIEKVLSSFFGLRDEAEHSVHIDVDGFRTEYSAHLERLAGRLAEAVERVGRPVVVAGMNDFERRVVHRAMQQAGGVETESFGHGTFRKMRVRPAP